jgi:PKD repeat protein
MRVIWVFLFFIFISFVSASVEIHNMSMSSQYSPFELIEGEINWTVTDESYDTPLTSNIGGEIKLGDFLNANGYLDFCTPLDCSNNYISSSGETNKVFDLSPNNSAFVGFYLEGDNVQITGLDFDFRSDFDGALASPVELRFFEDTLWEFSEFSDNDFSSWPSNFNNSASINQSPLLSVRYCEEFIVPKTNLLKVGANVGGVDSSDLKMVIYSDSGDELWCNLASPSVGSFCSIDAGNDWGFFEGVTYVCLEAESNTNYTLTSEEGGMNKGWAQPITVAFDIPSNYSHDFDILVEVAKYSDAGALSSIDWSGVKLDSKDLWELADEFILEKTAFTRDCSEGCVLPIEVSGISQQANIENVALTYFSTIPIVGDKVYDIEVSPALISFSGVSDLTLTNFNVSNSQEDSFILYLDDEKLFENDLDVLPAPIVERIYPASPPAGVPVSFYVDVDFGSNASLTYSWDFGDGKLATTAENTVVHTYAALQNYTLKVSVSAGGNLTSTKEQVINAINPAVAVNITLIQRGKELSEAIRNINALPLWYQDKIENMANISYFSDELARLERAKDNAFDDADFLEIAKSLYSADFDIPARIFVSDSSSSPFIGRLEDISPVIIDEFAGGSFDESSKEGYKNAILRWQAENIEGAYTKKIISMKSANNVETHMLSVYSFDLTSLSYDESYFVVSKNYGDLYFSEEVSARKVGEASLMIFGGEEQKMFEFYFEGDGDAPFFISPKLGSLILEEEIDTTCNHDNFCNKDVGENYRNCRNDCKPVGRMIIYIILAMFLVLALYTFLQVWYKRRYEKHLFSDRRQLYNLLMFISNSRARGSTDSKIKEDLLEQGWSRERVAYVIRKSRGERVGLYEIIPLEKFFSWWRNKKAAKSIATRNQQQNVGNINKSRFPRAIR